MSTKVGTQELEPRNLARTKICPPDRADPPAECFEPATSFLVVLDASWTVMSVRVVLASDQPFGPGEVEAGHQAIGVMHLELGDRHRQPGVMHASDRNRFGGRLGLQGSSPGPDGFSQPAEPTSTGSAFRPRHRIQHVVDPNQPPPDSLIEELCQAVGRDVAGEVDEASRGGRDRKARTRGSVQIVERRTVKVSDRGGSTRRRRENEVRIARWTQFEAVEEEPGGAGQDRARPPDHDDGGILHRSSSARQPICRSRCSLDHAVRHKGPDLFVG